MQHRREPDAVGAGVRDFLVNPTGSCRLPRLDGEHEGLVGELALDPLDEVVARGYPESVQKDVEPRSAQRIEQLIGQEEAVFARVRNEDATVLRRDSEEAQDRVDG